MLNWVEPTGPCWRGFNQPTRERFCGNELATNYLHLGVSSFKGTPFWVGFKRETDRTLLNFGVSQQKTPIWVSYKNRGSNIGFAVWDLPPKTCAQDFQATSSPSLGFFWERECFELCRLKSQMTSPWDLSGPGMRSGGPGSSGSSKQIISSRSSSRGSARISWYLYPQTTHKNGFDPEKYGVISHFYG